MRTAERIRFAVGYAKGVVAFESLRAGEMAAHHADVVAELDALEPYLLAALAVAERHPHEMAAQLDEPAPYSQAVA